MKIPSVDSFFDSLSNNGANIINFVSANAYKQHNSNLTRDEVIMRSINDSCDAYFQVNSKKGNLDAYSCNFIDIDAGRDVNGEYFSQKIVKKFKKRVVKKLLEDKNLRPTYVVETRNGYHCYWVYHSICVGNDSTQDLAINKKWYTIQTKLLFRFKSIGADGWAIDQMQLLRVPGSIWNKVWSGKNKPFKVRLTSIGKSTKRYTMNELDKEMNDQANFTIRALESQRKKSASLSARTGAIKGNSASDLSEDADVITDVAKYIRDKGMSILAAKLDLIASKM